MCGQDAPHAAAYLGDLQQLRPAHGILTRGRHLLRQLRMAVGQQDDAVAGHDLRPVKEDLFQITYMGII